MPSREDAWNLLCEYTNSESLRNHRLAGEACVRADARSRDEGGSGLGRAVRSSATLVTASNASRITAARPGNRA